MSAEVQTNLPEAKLPEQTQATQQAESAVSNSEVKQEDSPNQINWRKFREERAKERKEKEDSDRRAKQKEEEAAALKAALESVVKPRQEIDQGEEKSQEQIIKETVQQALKEERKARQEEDRQREIKEMPTKLVQTFSDFHQVVTAENLDYLQYHHPEIWAGYKNSLENFETYTGLYKAIKKYIPITDSKREIAKIEKNLNKPQSMSQPGMTATGDHAPHKLDDKRRNDNWLRMRKVMKGV